MHDSQRTSSTTTPTTTPTTVANFGPFAVLPPVFVLDELFAVAVDVLVVEAAVAMTHPEVEARCDADRQLPSVPYCTAKLTADLYPPASVSVRERSVPPHTFTVQSTDVFVSAVQDSRGMEVRAYAMVRV